MENMHSLLDRCHGMWYPTSYINNVFLKIKLKQWYHQNK